MTRPVLTLPYRSTDYDGPLASWNVTMHKMLVDSGVFDIQYQAAAHLPFLGHRRANCVSIFRVDGHTCILDTWDTEDPSASMWNTGWFRQYRRDEITLLKIQYRDHPLWKEMREFGYRVTPWSMFKSREFRPGFFQWRPGPHRWTAVVTGVPRHGRDEFESSRPDVYYSLDKQALSFSAYEHMLQQSTWGVSLMGKRDTDGKNRREVEFASCGMPLALNYQPTYPFPFRPGKEFMLIRDASDYETLARTDPEPFARASRWLWEEHFSPAGSAKTLLDLIGPKSTR